MITLKNSNQTKKIILWKIIAYCFLFSIFAINIWLVVFVNQKPVRINNNLACSFLYLKNAFEPIKGATEMIASSEGIAFYSTSSIVLILAFSYGAMSYKLYRVRALWTYFAFLALFCLSYIVTYILINSMGLNGIGIYELTTDANSKLNSINLNLFWSLNKLSNGLMQYNKLSISWTYNIAEIICFIVSLPLVFVYSVSRRLNPDLYYGKK